MYYTLEYRTDKEAGNVFPQASCINQDLAHRIPFDKLISLDEEILFQIEPKAILTDVLSQAAISADGLLLNKKVKDLLADFNIMQHRYYKCNIKDLKGFVHEYYWLHISDYSMLDKIDYKKSSFYSLKYGFREANISLDSYTDYKIQKDHLGKMWGIGSDFIKLNNEFDYSLDLFNVPIFGKKIYASKNLAMALDASEMKGFLLKETPLIE